MRFFRYYILTGLAIVHTVSVLALECIAGKLLGEIGGILCRLYISPMCMGLSNLNREG